MKKLFKKNNIIFFVSSLMFILTRLFFVIKTDGFVNGDDAVYGLMGKYIMGLKDFPLFMWGAHYSGTISCYILAFLFKIFGVSSYLYKMIMILWEFLGVLAFSYLFNKKIRAYIPLFFIIPLEGSFLFSPYVELPFLGISSYLIIKKIYEGLSHNSLFFILGFLNGFGLYHQPVYFPFFLTSLFFILKSDFIREFKKRIYLEIGFMTGILPLLVYNIINPFATIGRIGGMALAGIGGKSNSGLSDMINSICNYFSYNLVFIFLVSIVFIIFIKKDRSFLGKISLYSVIISFLFYLLPGVRKDRYLLPFFYSINIFVVLFSQILWDKNKKIFYAFIILIFFVGLFRFEKYVNNFSYYDYRGLSYFLIEKNIKYAYSDYWTAYPVTFHSQEKVIISPRLNDSMGFYDRTPWYYDLVKKENEKCFIFPKNDLNLEEKLINRLNKMKIKYLRYSANNFFIVTFNYKGDDSLFLI
jgi:hypothetical protein